MAESYAASIPMVVLMSDIALDLVGRDLGALHEVANPDRAVITGQTLVVDGGSVFL